MRTPPCRNHIAPLERGVELAEVYVSWSALPRRGPRGGGEALYDIRLFLVFNSLCERLILGAIGHGWRPRDAWRRRGRSAQQPRRVAPGCPVHVDSVCLWKVT